MNIYRPLSKEEVRIIEKQRGSVSVNGGHLEQSPFRHLNPSDYPNS